MRRKYDESAAARHQYKAVFPQSEAQNFIYNIGQKLTRVLSRKNSDYYKDKNVILASAGPSLETQLDDIATY